MTDDIGDRFPSRGCQIFVTGPHQLKQTAMFLFHPIKTFFPVKKALGFPLQPVGFQLEQPAFLIGILDEDLGVFKDPLIDGQYSAA
jgi:hypothetical protein